MSESDRPVRRAFVVALTGNLVVALAKVLYGTTTGTLAVIADGLHSVVDAGGSLIGLLSIRVARRPSDLDHHYGHHKFETLAALAIGGFIALSAWEVTQGAIARFRSGVSAEYSHVGPIIIVITIIFNAALSSYERRVAEKHGSAVLAADALHTRSDVLVSTVVLASLLGVRAGIPWIDPLLSILIAAYLAWIAFQVVKENVLELSDAAFLDPAAIEAIAREVPGVIDCHEIRTRGREGAAFVDLHIQIAPETDTAASHRIVHEVDDLILRRISGVRDVIIHTEPFPDPGDPLKESGGRDPAEPQPPRR